MKLRIEPEENTLDHEMDFHLMDENGLSVCVAIQSVEQAREIVSVVNYHEGLVNLLNRCLEFVEMHSNRYDGFNTEHPQVLAEQARALLAALEAEKGGKL